MCGNGRKCNSSRKLVIRLLLSRCYCFRARGVVSVVCSFVQRVSSHSCETLQELLPDPA